MANQKQQSLLKEPRKNTKLWWIATQQVYGGSLNYRKCGRPFDKNKLVHVVLKAHEWARFDQRPNVKTRIHQVAKRCYVDIKDMAINKDHIHLLVSSSKRRYFVNFLRQVAAGLGHLVKDALEKLNIKKTESLWVKRPFSRLVSWGRKSVQAIKNYIHKNRQEAMGFIAYRPRKHRLSLFLAQWGKSLTSYSSA